MYLVTGTVRLNPGARDAMAEAGAAMVEETRKEDGCHACRYAFDLQDPDVMTFHEEWESPAAMKAHRDAPHMAEFGRKMMGGLVTDRPQVSVWTAEPASMG